MLKFPQLRKLWQVQCFIPFLTDCEHVKWVQLSVSLNILWHCPSLDLNENWPFPVLWSLVFQIYWHTWVQHQVYCYPAYLTSMQSISCKMKVDETQSGTKVARRKTNNLRHADDNSLMTENEEPLGEGERGNWKSSLETQNSKK